MINKWQVNNFKSIRNMPEPIELAPLTILTGTNSSGKSAVLQSILMASQTVKNHDREVPLLLSGRLVNLGKSSEIADTNKALDIEAILGKSNEELNIGFGLVNAASERENDIVSHIKMQTKEMKKKEKRILIKRSEEPRTKSEEEWYELMTDYIGFVYYKNKDDPLMKFFKENYKDISKLNELISFDVGIEKNDNNVGYAISFSDLKELISKDNPYKENYKYLSKPIGCFFKNFIPQAILYEVDKVKEYARAIVDILTGENESDPDRMHEFRHGFTDYYCNFSATFNGEDIEYYLTENIVSLICDFINKHDFNNHKLPKTAKEIYKDLDAKFEIFDESQGNTMRVLFCWDYKGYAFKDIIQGILKEHEGELLSKVEEAIREDKFMFNHLVMEFNDDCPWLKDISRDDDEDDEDFCRTTKGLRVVELPISNILKDLSTVRYLGPLRDTNKPLFPLNQHLGDDYVGNAGENIAKVIAHCGDRQIQYCKPEGFLIGHIDFVKSIKGASGSDLVTVNLSKAVNEWLKYLEIADSVEVEDKGSLGFVLKVTQHGQKRDLASVGTGVSQVLPILVTGLLAPVDSTLIFEQPELHLHPRAQSLLADFFISLIIAEKQCIVETHSEYIIDKIRYRIASDIFSCRKLFSDEPVESLQDMTKIYFLEKKDADCEFTPIDINEYGVMSDWPEGFFDESQELALDLMSAAAERRKKAKTTGK
jgi:predicted ATPase